MVPLSLNQSEDALYIYIPTGAFGVVSLVKERATGQLFAMKQVFAYSFILFFIAANVYLAPMTSYARQTCYGKGKRATSVLSAIFSCRHL